MEGVGGGFQELEVDGGSGSVDGVGVGGGRVELCYQCRWCYIMQGG